MPPQAIKFGTDGWRAVMDEEFTLPNVEKVAQAFSDYLNSRFKKKSPSYSPKVVIGFDQRKNSPRYAQAIAEVLIANQIETLLGRSECPTPAVSLGVVQHKADAGIMVTASHNPPQYNGIKIKSHYGGSADEATTRGIEGFLEKTPVRKRPFGTDSPKILDLTQEYLVHLQTHVHLDRIRNSPFKVLADSMHGVGKRHLEELIKGGTIEVTTIRSEPDVSFGGLSPEPIPANLAAAIQRMKSHPFDLCLVTDGDGDRIGVLRPGGEFVTAGIILSLLLLHLAEDLHRHGSVVTTISNTALVYRVAQHLGLKVHETPVGFKHIAQIMRRETVLIGGEESGGIGFPHYLCERDGLLTGLYLLEMMAMRQKSFEGILQEVEHRFGKRHYLRRDLGYPQELKGRLFTALSEHPPKTFLNERVAQIQTLDGVKLHLADQSWLLFRLSGTEPILRIYAEAPSAAKAAALVQEGERLAFELPKS